MFPKNTGRNQLFTDLIYICVTVKFTRKSLSYKM